MKKVAAGELKAEDLTGVSKDYYGNCFNDDKLVSWGWQKMFWGENSSFSVIEQVLDQNLTFVDNFVGAPTTTMVDRWQTLTDLTNTTITKIIMGQEDVEAGFTEFVNTWNTSGGEQITKEVNEWYSSNIKN